jgi:hypothetical protein
MHFWRAKGADQNFQPNNHDPNLGSYVINNPLPIDVFVTGAVHNGANAKA